MHLTVSNYMRQKLIELQGEIDEYIIVVGDFKNTSSRNRFNRTDPDNHKNIVELNNIINQLDIIDINRLLHPAMAEYTFFSSSHGIFTKIDHILGHKTHINTFKRIENIECLLSDHSGIKLEINKEP